MLQMHPEHLQLLITQTGEIPAHHACPEVRIQLDEDYESGKQAIATYENPPVTPGNVQCPSCGEENPANFQLCWKCGGGLEVAETVSLLDR